jgi:hypothetical protein
MGQIKNAYRILVGNPLEDSDSVGVVKLKKMSFGDRRQLKED